MSVLASLLLLAGVAQAQHIAMAPQSFAFEDVPSAGNDGDFNDLVIGYRGYCDLDAAADVVRQRLVWAPIAGGASLDNTLAIRPAAPIGNATVNGVPVAPTGGVIVLAQHFDDAFTGGPSGFVNTTGGPFYGGPSNEVTLTFAAPTDFGGGCPVPDFELHRAAEGVVIDLDSRAAGTGRPLAGNFSGWFRSPREQVGIWEAYGQFMGWAADMADGTCDTTCGTTPWYATYEIALVDPRDATALAGDVPLPDLATCTDEVLNGDETEVDCGDPLGVCGPCTPPHARVIYRSATNVMISELDGTNEALLGTVPGNWIQNLAYDPIGQDAYVIAGSSSPWAYVIWRQGLVGDLLVGAPELVVSVYEVRDVAVSHERGDVYHTGRSTSGSLDGIWRADFADGQGHERLYTAAQVATGIAYDPVTDAIYWGDFDGKVYRGDPDGTGMVALITRSGEIADVAVDSAGGRIYWSENGNGVWSAAIDGTDIRQVAAGFTSLGTNVAFDPITGRVYWVIDWGGGLQSALFDGSDLQTHDPNAQEAGIAIVSTP